VDGEIKTSPSLVSPTKRRGGRKREKGLGGERRTGGEKTRNTNNDLTLTVLKNPRDKRRTSRGYVEKVGETATTEGNVGVYPSIKQKKTFAVRGV